MSVSQETSLRLENPIIVRLSARAVLFAKNALYRWRQAVEAAQQLRAVLHLYVLAPQNQTDDARRREYVVNVLTVGFVLTALVKLTYLLAHPAHYGFDQEEHSLVAGSIIILLSVGLWKLSRLGYYRLAAALLLTLLTAEAIRLNLIWSFELPTTQLMYALVIVIAGILLSTRAALAVSGLLIASLLAVSYDQISDHLQPRVDWLRQDFQMIDAVGYASFLVIIVTVSWLANREIVQSLARARASEIALQVERDNLEVKVAQRTRQLRETELQRNAEVQRFADFGRLSAGLLHEIANPLTAISLHLEQMDNQQSDLVVQARRSVRQMERYINAVRQQVKPHSTLCLFSTRDEMEMVVSIMLPIAARAGIKLIIKQPTDCHIYGDAVKFDHIVTNLVANSIDAYQHADSPGSPKRIEISGIRNGQWFIISVTDWGKGLDKLEKEQLFDAFYSTKEIGNHNMGIGLTMIKQIVETDFSGSLSVASNPTTGTRFTALLLVNKPGGGLRKLATATD